MCLSSNQQTVCFPEVKFSNSPSATNECLMRFVLAQVCCTTGSRLFNMHNATFKMCHSFVACLVQAQGSARPPNGGSNASLWSHPAGQNQHARAGCVPLGSQHALRHHPQPPQPRLLCWRVLFRQRCCGGCWLMPLCYRSEASEDRRHNKLRQAIFSFNLRIIVGCEVAAQHVWLHDYVQNR